jgi:hypothetical protein
MTKKLNHMRKIFRIASFALLLAVGVACSTDDVPQEPLGTYPILFRCMDETRAVATVGSMQSDTNGFDVYAFFTNNAINASQSFNKTVKYDDASGKWLYSGLEYWIPGATYYFKAVYPTTINYAVDNSTTTQPLTITGYDITNQYDILVAEAGPLTVDPVLGAPESGSVVSLQFKHLLANVTINALSELATPVDIERVELRTVATKADYSGAWNTGNYGSSKFGYDSDLTLNKATSETDYTDITNGGILVIPEQINGTQKVYVKTSFKEYDIAFPTTYSWNAGQKYTYTLIIKQENIEFNEPKVEIWDEENATGSVVIK